MRQLTVASSGVDLVLSRAVLHSRLVDGDSRHHCGVALDHLASREPELVGLRGRVRLFATQVVELHVAQRWWLRRRDDYERIIHVEVVQHLLRDLGPPGNAMVIGVPVQSVPRLLPKVPIGPVLGEWVPLGHQGLLHLPDLVALVVVLHAHLLNGGV
jgi:hypothetical protein